MPALSIIATYSQVPTTQHYKAAIHTLKYLYSTSNYGISFTLKASSTLQANNHFPHHHDKEPYTDVTPPSLSKCEHLTAFSNTC